MDKMFTAVVIGQLVDEGKLSFQDPVSKFLGGQGLDEGRPLEGARRAPAEPHLGPRLVLQRHLRAHGAPAPAEGRRLQAARGRGDARLRARHEVAVQQHRLPARRGGDRGRHRARLLRRGARARLREGRHAEQRQLRHRPRRPEPGDRLLARADGHGSAVAREHVRARHPRRPGRRRLLDRAGPPRVRRGDAQGAAREPRHRASGCGRRSPSCTPPTTASASASARTPWAAPPATAAASPGSPRSSTSTSTRAGRSSSSRTWTAACSRWRRSSARSPAASADPRQSIQPRRR